MSTRLYLFTALMSIGSICAFAQDETDAVRYSYLSPQATARSMGFGGALGSIGGDFGSLSVNPAGIGIYRSSEFTFTPSLKMGSTSSSYMGTTTADNNTRFTINNLGVVFTNAQRGRRYERAKWKSVSFGLGIARSADFNRNYSYGAFNKTSSGSEAFSIDANQFPSDVQNPNTLAGLGYQSYLVNYDAADSTYVPIVNFSKGTNQSRTVKERGGITDINISLGGNYEEKLMLGATLGIPSLYYNMESSYSETDASGDPNNSFASFNFTKSLTTRGSGINLKLGFIYKANDYFRIGAAFHTPTYFQLKDIFNEGLTANTESYHGVVHVDAQEYYAEYSLFTPWRGVISAAGIIGKYGFITADYEYVNYASARFDYNSTDAPTLDAERAANNLIKTSLKGASNFRIGAEGRIEAFALRLGFGYYGSPYNNTNVYGDRTDVSAGLGFRQDNWYLDLGFTHSEHKQVEYPYVLNYAAPVGIIAPVANINSSLNNMAVTVGFKF